MIIGNKSLFAIESGITKAYCNQSLRALGFFILHIENKRYGIQSPEATMLGCSYDQVQNRIAFRGKHTAPFATVKDAEMIADSFRAAIYSAGQEDAVFFAMSKKLFCDIIYSNGIIFAPDGDEAFDDGSYVLQFDIDDRVRIIAFKSDKTYRRNPETLCDLWLDSESFYNILKHWCDAFQVEWSSMKKMKKNEPTSQPWQD